MKQTHKFFSTPFYSTNIKRDFTKKEKNSYHSILEDNYENVKNVISKEVRVLEKDDFSDIREFINFHVDNFYIELYGRKAKNLSYITTSWLNLTEPGMSHHRHHHPNSIISGVFYFNCIPNDTITIHKPFSTVINSINIDPEGNSESLFLGESLNISLITGDLILFPSDLEHQVAENKTKFNRISLAFNTFIKGTLSDGVNTLNL